MNLKASDIVLGVIVTGAWFALVEFIHWIATK